MIEKIDKDILDMMISNYLEGKYNETDDAIKSDIESFIMVETPEYLKEAFDYFLRGINKMDNKNVHKTLTSEQWKKQIIKLRRERIKRK